MRIRRPLALPLLTIAVVLTGAPAARSRSASTARWTDVTPDAMVDDAAGRAGGTAHTEHGQLAAMATIAALATQASNDKAHDALAQLGGSLAEPEPRAEAALLARSLSGDEGTPAGQRADHALGVVEGLSVLGPFRDTGGGLDAHDGPEAEKTPFDPAGRYAWGTFDVAWREVPRAFAQASGTALDVFVFPRKESCSWLASAITVAKRGAARRAPGVDGAGAPRLRRGGRGTRRVGERVDALRPPRGARRGGRRARTCSPRRCAPARSTTTARRACA